jgi:hypothetical protein
MMFGKFSRRHLPLAGFRARNGDARGSEDVEGNKPDRRPAGSRAAHMGTAQRSDQAPSMKTAGSFDLGYPLLITWQDRRSGNADRANDHYHRYKKTSVKELGWAIDFDRGTRVF